MRQVKVTTFVEAAVARAAKELPSFPMVFDGIVWQLSRMPLDEAQEIAGRSPPIYVLETNAWRAAGIPPLSIGFQRIPDGIEIVQLTLREPPNPRR